jgi:xylitol oxidase
VSVGTNWAGNYTYGAAELRHPQSTSEVQTLVSRGTPLRALGSRHSFNPIADTTGDLVSLDRFEPNIVVDETARTVSFAAGLRYGDLASELQARGWALHNLASLPHISVAGAVATATHGSGDRNGNLATAVSAFEFVDGTGEVVTLRRGDADFAGAVVGLGALGIVTRLTLDVEPTFDVRQDVFTGLRWDEFLGNIDAITSSAYSVSVFTNWLGDSIGAVWLKSRMDAPTPPVDLFGAVREVTNLHPLPDMPAGNTTPQGGVPGPWSERLAHFVLGFTPSNGDELQSEFLVPRHNIAAALASLRELGDQIAPLLHITELRTMAADDLWLSGASGTDAVGIHFTWKKLPTEVLALLPEIERRLLPLNARPHWGKVFTADGAQLDALYPRLPDFRDLVRKYDPQGLFRNEFLHHRLGL